MEIPKTKGGIKMNMMEMMDRVIARFGFESICTIEFCSIVENAIKENKVKELKAYIEGFYKGLMSD